VGRYGISASDIAVLSHFEAQCSLISLQLQQQFSDITMSTVNSAYGTHLLLLFSVSLSVVMICTKFIFVTHPEIPGIEACC